MIPSALLQNEDWLSHGFGTRADVWLSPAATLKQIHSSTVWAVTKTGVAGEGDALVTAEPGLALTIRTADCYPILLADPKRRAVAAIHAGWRGTAARVAPATVEKMRHLFGTNPVDIVAAIGPGIGACCYEVGPEVVRRFDAAFVQQGHLDLSAANRQQLLESGVEPRNVSASDFCTFCQAQDFYSYRREKEQGGRMTSFIQIR